MSLKQYQSLSQIHIIHTITKGTHAKKLEVKKEIKELYLKL